MTTNSLPTQGQGMAAAPFFWLGALIYGVVVLAVYLFAVRRAGGDWSVLGVRPFSGWWVALAPVLTLVQLLGMSLVNIVFVLPFTGGEFENPQVEALTGGSALSLRDLGLLLILVAVIAPIAEELSFGGMLYPAAPPLVTASGDCGQWLSLCPNPLYSNFDSRSLFGGHDSGVGTRNAAVR